MQPPGMGWGIVLIVFGTIASVSPAGAAVDEGSAEHIPWSGYWWPIAKGELLEPLGKYDTLTGKRAVWWELENHPPGPQAPPWHGYCHGWAAAAVLEQEPTQPRIFESGGTPTVLSVADQKGWYAACHAFDAAEQFGDRYGDDEGSEDMQDMRPDLLWQLLKTFLKERRRPLVMDFDAGPDVWNYPVFAYRIEYQPLPDRAGWYRGQLQLLAADDAVPPESVGTTPYLQTYTFVVQMRGDAIVPGSGQWTGQSVWNHPDFAWYPSSVVPENPELHYGAVQKLIKAAVPRTPETSVAPSPESDLAGGGKPESLLKPVTHGQQPPLLAWLGVAQAPAGLGADAIPQAISPLQLVAAIAEQTSHFGLDAWLVPFGRTRYHVGERTTIAGSSERAGYLYALHVAPTGELELVYPAPGQDNHIAAGVPFSIPDARQGEYAIRGPLGNHRLKILVTERPLILTGLDRRAPLEATPAADAPARGPADGGGPATWRGFGFRLFSAQERHMKALLQDYVQGKPLTPEQLDQIDATRVLPPFAQDEITYYVGAPN